VSPPLPAPLAARLPRWLAVPWVDHGRSLQGWDCWGLCVVVGAEAFDLALPPYAGVVSTADAGTEVSAALSAEAGRRFRLTAHVPGAVRLFAWGGQPLHCGLHLTERLVLHCCQGVGTLLTDLADPLSPWHRRARGAYAPAPDPGEGPRG
jgi:cell wall-associated NlpC family hydrolase